MELGPTLGNAGAPDKLNSALQHFVIVAAIVWNDELRHDELCKLLVFGIGCAHDLCELTGNDCRRSSQEERRTHEPPITVKTVRARVDGHCAHISGCPYFFLKLPTDDHAR